MTRLDERDAGLANVVGEAVRAGLVDLHTALPGRIEAYDAASQTATVVPEVQRRFRRADGTTETVAAPSITDVPVLFPRAGGYAITFPVQAGDKCLVLFAERDLEGWRLDGDEAPPPTARMHDYADAVALLGLWPTPDALSPAADGSSLQVRSDDGAKVVEVGTSGISVQSDEAVSIEAAGGAGVTIETTSGPVAITSVGAITITRGASELLDLLSQTLQALATESVGGGATPIDGQATYAALKVLVDAMRV